MGQLQQGSQSQVDQDQHRPEGQAGYPDFLNRAIREEKYILTESNNSNRHAIKRRSVAKMFRRLFGSVEVLSFPRNSRLNQYVLEKIERDSLIRVATEMRRRYKGIGFGADHFGADFTITAPKTSQIFH